MRRFIAGAVCPNCRALDRLVVEVDESGERLPQRVCVACGFTEELSVSDPSIQSAAAVPRGRVEGGRLQPQVVEPTAVKIVSAGQAGKNANEPDTAE
ncbi:MAG: YheV family putative metal-binding protein [Pseudomonadota bacterium]